MSSAFNVKGLLFKNFSLFCYLYSYCYIINIKPCLNVNKFYLSLPVTVIPSIFYSLFHPSRWIKFEEKVEKGGERWSKPHVATLSLHSLFELRTCIEKGTIMLDMEASTLPQVVGKFGRLPEHL